MFFRCLGLFLGLFCFCPDGAVALCVNTAKAHLYAEPSYSAKKLWTVGRYMPLLELRSKGAWYQVKDLDGEKMWIPQSKVTYDFDCAVIKVGKSTLRRGPGTRHPQTPLSYAGKYMAFKKIRRDEAWLHLEDDFGFRHWVFENNLWEPLAYTTIDY